MDGKCDAEAGAFALDHGEFFAGVPRCHPVAALLPLVTAGLGIKSAGLSHEITPAHHQGSGAWCWRTSRPKLVALLAASGSRSAENSSAKPAGSPFR